MYTLCLKINVVGSERRSREVLQYKIGLPMLNVAVIVPIVNIERSHLVGDDDGKIG